MKNNKDLEIIIVTGDLDALQLVNERVKVFTLKKSINDTITYDIAAIKERYGLEPRQLIDLKAIQGDASDNIKGVKGIGQKGAQDLIKKFNLVCISFCSKKADIQEKFDKLIPPANIRGLFKPSGIIFQSKVSPVPPRTDSLAVSSKRAFASVYFLDCSIMKDSDFAGMVLI